MRSLAPGAVALTLPLLLALTAGGAALAPRAAAAEADAAPAGAEAPAGEAAAAGDEAAAGEERAYDADTVLATVDGTAITLGHVVALTERLPEQFKALPDETLLQGLVDQLIDQQLLARTLSAAPEEDPLAVRLHLENERRSSLATEVILDRAAEEVEEAAIEEAYQALVAEFEPQTEYNASHIIVESEEEAAAIRAELDAGGDFAELAEAHSRDGTAARGGELGWFGPGMMVPEFEAEVSEMEVGEVRGPVETQFGWHLIRLNDVRQTEPPALEDVRDVLADQIRQARLTEEIEALRDAAQIERPEAPVPASAIRDTAVLAD